jgi:hypothetical protein
VSPSVLRALLAMQRDARSDSSWLFFYYRRKLRWGWRRASYHAAADAFYSPLDLAQRGYVPAYLPR